jgi:uracil-DNA glycosylase
MSKFNYERSRRRTVLGDMLPAATAISAQGIWGQWNLTTQNAAQQLSALLAWYQEMGVSVAVGDDAINWCQRGDAPPGADFELVALPGAAAIRPEEIDRSRPRPTAQSQPTTRNQSGAPPSSTNVAAVRGIVARNVGEGGVKAAPVKISATTLAELRAELDAFEGCGLKATAKSLCFYRGAEHARVMVIGEAPGRDEDSVGHPFAGPAGLLLDAMLGAIGLSEADAHITNVVYWRPPGNRKPTAQETAACAPFILRQIALVGPTYLLILGEVAAKQLLATSDGIMKVRGKWGTISCEGREIRALATLHPAYVLKVPAAKRQVWRDLLTLKLAVSGSDGR